MEIKIRNASLLPNGNIYGYRAENDNVRRPPLQANDSMSGKENSKFSFYQQPVRPVRFSVPDGIPFQPEEANLRYHPPGRHSISPACSSRSSPTLSEAASIRHRLRKVS